MTTGTMDLTIMSGFNTPIEAIPMLDLAVPYEAPKPAQGQKSEELTRESKGEGDTEVSEKGSSSSLCNLSHY